MRVDDPLLNLRCRRSLAGLVVALLGVLIFAGAWWQTRNDAEPLVPSSPESADERLRMEAEPVEIIAAEPRPVSELHPGSQTAQTAEKIDHRAPDTIAYVNELVRTQPARALRMLVALPASPERDAALVHAAAQWVVVEPHAAIAWARGMERGRLREEVCAAVATAWADRDPRGAADFVATEIADSATVRNAAVGVAQRWVQSDGPSAMQWVGEFPRADLRRMATDATLRVWLATDGAGLRRWLESMPVNPESEEIRGVLAAVDGAGR